MTIKIWTYFSPHTTANFNFKKERPQKINERLNVVNLHYCFEKLKTKCLDNVVLIFRVAFEKASTTKVP